MLAEWARAAWVSLGCTHRDLRPRLLRSWLCRRKVRSSFALSFIVPPPQVLTEVVAAWASFVFTSETDTATTVAKTVAARNTAQQRRIMDSPSLHTLVRTLQHSLPSRNRRPGRLDLVKPRREPRHLNSFNAGFACGQQRSCCWLLGSE